MNFASIISPAQTTPSARRNAAPGNAGFSLLEMTIVVAIVMIVGVIALLLAQEVIRSVHLQETASNYSNLLQQARVRAVRDDQYYAVVTVAAQNGNPAYAFVDLKQTGIYASGDPEFFFSADVKPVTSTGSCTISNLDSQYLPTGNHATINPSTAVFNTFAGPTFGPRGLPCDPTATSGGTCAFLATPTAYEIYLKNVRSRNYEAVTVTPAGRIRQWSCGSSGTWNPMN